MVIIIMNIYKQVLQQKKTAAEADALATAFLIMNPKKIRTTC